MPTYVAFLRGINLGARRKFPMAAVRACAEQAGFTDVATHINSGNLRLRTTMRSRRRVEDALEAAFAADRGFDVPTVVFGTTELAGVAADAEELAAAYPGAERHFVHLVREEPTAEVRAELEGRSEGAARVAVRGRSVHLLHGPGYVPGRTDPTGVERLLGVSTTRNARVVATLVDQWCRGGT